MDPVPTNPNTGGNFNRYWYANNNPYKFTDPDGRCPACAGIVLGAIFGAGGDYAVQKIFNSGQPVNKTELAVAAVAGAISGGTGGALVGAVARGGAMSVGKAVAIQTGVNAATGAGSVVAQGAIEGKAVTGTQIAIGATASAAGGLVASGTGAAAGDFAAAARQGTLTRMASSSAPGASNIASTTLSTGNAVAKQSTAQAFMSQAGQAAAGAVAQKKIEEKIK